MSGCNQIFTDYQSFCFHLSSHSGTYLLRSLMDPATSSSSHFGVEVAPQTPTLSSALNQSLLISATESMWYVRMFRDLHRSHRTFPFELALPDTNMIMSCSRANFVSFAWRDATCEQMVSLTVSIPVPLNLSTESSLW